ncbi:MAG: hypothetical protein PVI06_21550, partial [Desulfobacterales bacterium]
SAYPNLEPPKFKAALMEIVEFTTVVIIKPATGFYLFPASLIHFVLLQHNIYEAVSQFSKTVIPDEPRFAG